MRQIKDYMPEKDGKCATNFKTVTHTGNLQKVTLAHKTKHKGAIIKTRLGLDAYPSHDHKYYVLNPDLSITWKKAKDLNPGDMLAVQLGANLWATEAPDLTGLVLESEKEAKLLRKKDIRNRYPVSILGKMTPELARLLGYLVSEGHVTSARHGFAQKDKEILFDFLGCVEKCFGYRTGYHTNKKGVSHTGISRKEAFIFIEKLGISGNSWTKEIPWVIKQSPKEFVVEFLRGYFEGDGGTEDVWVKQKVMATTVSYELARQIQLILGNLGILSSRYFNNNKWYIHIRSEYVDAYAEIVGFVSSRKKEILECRTPTGKTHMGERLPYVKEVLDAFRENNFISRAAWFFDPISLPEDGRDIYTVSEAADLVGRDYTTLHFHIRKGRLKATKQGVGPDGKFLPSLIRKDDLLAFLESFGLSRKRTVPGRDAYGMTYNKLEQADLSLIKELDPKLYDKLKTLLETRFVWNEVISVELLDEEFEMGDLTVEEDASYSADGLVCHNSSTNVSLRMLENTYLGYMSDHYRLVRWVMKNIGAYLEWEPVTLKFKPFKMADDLQRKAYNFQLNQASKISDEALLRDADFDPDVERKTIISETNRSAESMKKTRLAQAEIEGEASLIQMRYQLKAQKEQMEMTQQAPAQGEPGAEVADATQGQTPEGATNQGAPEEPESQPENVPPQNASPQNGAPQAGMANVGLISSAQQLANYIFKLDPQSQNAALANLQEQNPELYSIVLQLKESVTPTQGGNANSASLPLPEQRPPRRGIESASI
jgi:intein/homing endonuclease